MAACTRSVGKVLSGCQRCLLSPSGQSFTRVPHFPQKQNARTYAAVKSAKKEQKEEKPKVEKKRIIDDTNRHKPYGLTAWKPIDDVYVTRYYPKPVYEVDTTIDMIKRFQQLDLTYPKQPVYIDLKLDMKLEKKKKVDPFVSVVHLPHPFKTEGNKVLVFTESAEQCKTAEEGGATFVGGTELIEKILDDQIQADFYLAVPEIIPKLLPLKNKLRKKFPKSNRGSVGTNIPKMLELFKTGHEYVVEKDCYITTQIATLDMPKEQIMSNLAAVVQDVCSHRPASFGKFVERAIICSATSEALRFKFDQFLPLAEDEVV
ncbi:large ribosomal subunit protein uL1m [Amia ocellicauda]|uniref:large ribosomal subunit protein uL1m n=1 Tax=Amia ocellicauda TaxID=2972642 RepID=UPI003464A462